MRVEMIVRCPDLPPLGSSLEIELRTFNIKCLKLTTRTVVFTGSKNRTFINVNKAILIIRIQLQLTIRSIHRSVRIIHVAKLLRSDYCNIDDVRWTEKTQ